MRAGALSRLVTLQRSTTVLNDAGTPTEAWEDLATLRAEVVELGTVEAIRQYGAAEVGTLVFRTRFYPGANLTDRLLFEGRTFNLKSVSTIGRNRGLELRAEALE